MRNLLLSCAMLLGVASAAQAATYTVDVSAFPFRAPGQDGLQTRAVVLSPVGAQNYNGSSVSVNLANYGDTFTTDIFGLVALDDDIEADDVIPQTTSASFSISGIGSTVLSGVSQAFGSGVSGFALASYANGFIRLNATDAIFISLADTEFGTDGAGNYVQGRPGVGFVEATFTLAPIPVPAALPLAATGLGLLGFAARRRKQKRAA